MDLFITCKEGFEKILASETALSRGVVQTKGRGWIISRWQETPALDLCFAYHILENPLTVSAASLNSFTDKLADLFLTHIKDMRIDGPWGFEFSSSGNEQLIHRAKTVEKGWLEKISKKVSRVAKLSKKGVPHSPQLSEGFFVHFTDFDQAFVSFKALSLGQQRMQMDPQAPSRSYLKLEEAFRIFGHEPKENETVVDLGAAPGGWSFSALKRRALVTAVDNGPLKGVVKSHPNMTHLQEDALTYRTHQPQPVDWLICDILEQPDIVLELIHKWVSQKWCRYFIVNFKIGRTDPIVILKKLKHPQKGLPPHCKSLSIRQLYHNREEITVLGETKE